MRVRHRFIASLAISLALVRAAGDAQDLALPNKPDSVKFVAIGDMGTGKKEQFEVAEQMVKFHDKFPYDTVIMLGDDLYGSQEPKDFVAKFEQPYKRLLD